MAYVKQSYEAKATAMFADGSYKSLEVPYIVTGIQNIEDGENEALNAVREQTPAKYHSLSLQYVEIESRDNDTTYHVKAVYEKNAIPGGGSDEQDDEATVSFDCGGGSTMVKNAYSQEVVFGSINPGTAVGWNGKYGDDSEISGVEVPTAQLRETYTKVMPLSRLTTQYKRNVADMVGCVNSTKFKGWEAGEVMFLGMSYSAPDKSSSRVTVTYNFLIQRNERVTINFTNGTTTTYDKKGFQYVWSISREAYDEKNKQPSVVLKGEFLADVCKYKDFGELGL